MQIAIHSFIALILLVIAYQDFKYRAIHWLTLPPLLILFVWGYSQFWASDELLSGLTTNLGFLFIQWLGITLYYSIKMRRPVQIINQFIGVGDLLFLGVCALAFSPLNFMLFTISGFLMSIIVHVLMQLKRGGRKTIPLAGLLAIWMLPFHLVPAWYAGSWNEQWIEQLLL